MHEYKKHGESSIRLPVRSDMQWGEIIIWSTAEFLSLITYREIGGFILIEKDRISTTNSDKNAWHRFARHWVKSVFDSLQPSHSVPALKKKINFFHSNLSTSTGKPKRRQRTLTRFLTCTKLEWPIQREAWWEGDNCWSDYKMAISRPSSGAPYKISPHRKRTTNVH